MAPPTWVPVWAASLRTTPAHRSYQTGWPPIGPDIWPLVHIDPTCLQQSLTGLLPALLAGDLVAVRALPNTLPQSMYSHASWSSDAIRVFATCAYLWGLSISRRSAAQFLWFCEATSRDTTFRRAYLHSSAIAGHFVIVYPVATFVPDIFSQNLSCHLPCGARRGRPIHGTVSLLSAKLVPTTSR